MKTLNRTLSLALVFALVFSLMSFAFAADTTTTTTTTTTPTTTTTTTPAATTTNTAAAFTDASSISHNNAVSTMTSLAVIKGYPDGSYKPATNVTRAEMAKMICLILNGGKEPVLSTSSTPKYTDIKGHWAQAYIEYCASANIVAGMGDGTFHPDDTVTASQAAKMLLVAMGYKSDVFNFTGSDWEVNVNVAANKANLYKEITDINASANLNRDNAAQMIYNAIFANTMAISYSQDQATGKITQNYNPNGATLAVTKFSLNVSTATLGAVTYNSAKKEYNYTIATTLSGSTAVTTETVISGPNSASGMSGITGNMKSTTDYSAYVGMKVRILWNIVNGTYTVYGVYPYDSSVLLAGVLGQVADTATYTTADNATLNKASVITSLTYGGKTYKFNGSAQTALTGANDAAIPTGIATFEEYLFDTQAAAKTASAVAKAKAASDLATAQSAVAKFNTDTGLSASITDTTNTVLADCIHQASFAFKMLDTNGDNVVDKVIVYPFTVDKVTYVGSTTATIGGNSYLLSDIKAYDGMAVGEYVKHTAKAYTADTIETFEKITPLAGTVTEVAAMKATIGTTTLGDFTSMTAGATYEKIYQVNGFIYQATLTVDAASAEHFAVVTKKAMGADAYGNWDVKLLLSDGTIKEVPVVKFDGKAVDDVTKLPTADTFVTYTVSSGKYTLTTVSTENHGNYTAYASVVDATKYSYTKGTINDIAIDDGAVVFAKDSSGYKVITGATLKTAHSMVSPIKYLTKKNDSTGFSNILCASVDLTAQAVGTTQYGYVTAAIATTKDKDKKDVSKVTFWNGTENVTKTADADYTDVTSPVVTTALAQGKYFTYTEDKDGIITILDVASGDPVDFFNPTVGYVSAYVTDGKTIEINGAGPYIVDDKTVVFNVDSTNMKGVAGKAIVMATGTANNCVYSVETDKGETYLRFIAIDSKNAMTYTAPTAVGFGDKPTTKSVQDALNNANYTTVTVTGDMTLDKALEVPTGKTLKVTGALEDGGFALTEATETGKTAGAVAVTGALTLTSATTAVAGSVTAGSVVATSNAITVTGSLTSKGTIDATSVGVSGTGAVNAAGKITAAVTNNGTGTVTAKAGITGAVTNSSTGTIDVTATITGDVTNSSTGSVTADVITGAIANTSTGTVTVNKKSTDITTVSNKGTIEVKDDATFDSISGTGEVKVSTADKTLTLTNNSTIGTLTATGKVAVTAQLTVSNAATVATLNNITGVTKDTSKLILSAKSSDKTTAASTTYYTKASAAVATTTEIPADTYTWKASDGSTGTNAWVGTAS